VRWKERGLEERTLFVLAVALYFMAFVATIVCGVGDAVIDNYDNYLGPHRDEVAPSVLAPDWVTYALDIDGRAFETTLARWYRANALRFVCALAGWCAIARLQLLSPTATVLEQALVDVEARLEAEQVIATPLLSFFPTTHI